MSVNNMTMKEENEFLLQENARLTRELVIIHERLVAVTQAIKQLNEKHMRERQTTEQYRKEI
jgi:hypothetical protein